MIRRAGCETPPECSLDCTSWWPDPDCAWCDGAGWFTKQNGDREQCDCLGTCDCQTEFWEDDPRL